MAAVGLLVAALTISAIVVRKYTLFASDERLAARILSAVGEVRGADAIRDRLSSRCRVLAAGAWGDFQLDELRDDPIAPSAYVQVGIGSYRIWPIWYSVEGFVLLDDAGGAQKVVIRRVHEAL